MKGMTATTEAEVAQ